MTTEWQVKLRKKWLGGELDEVSVELSLAHLGPSARHNWHPTLTVSGLMQGGGNRSRAFVVRRDHLIQFQDTSYTEVCIVCIRFLRDEGALNLNNYIFAYRLAAQYQLRCRDRSLHANLPVGPGTPL